MTEILKFEHVSYESEGQRILTDINFSVNTGDDITLSGPSGAGKSTILLLMAQMISPTAGRILFNNTDIKDLAVTEYRRQVSYAFQQPTLFGSTVGDNVRFPFEIRKESIDERRINHLLTLVDLPTNYIGKKNTELSGGERQRVALVRNLLFHPQVLLLDEITTGLDAENKQLVYQLIDMYRKNNGTVVQITHDEQELERASHIYQISGGKLISEDNKNA